MRDWCPPHCACRLLLPKSVNWMPMPPRRTTWIEPLLRRKVSIPFRFQFILFSTPPHSAPHVWFCHSLRLKKGVQ